ncbi:MAG: glycosyltransferase [Patescibacteria group bacterium]|nr:glycosyltransferase [Patescibacteria group bacterium]
MCASTPKPRFIYITEYDISIDNGPGINEREFIDVLCKSYGEEVICLVPFPTYPEKYIDPRIEYVINHKRSNKLRYWAYLIDTFIRALRLYRRYHFSASVVRIGQTPFVPLMLSWLLKTPLLLKTLAQYTKFSGLKSPKQIIRNKILTFLYRATIKRALISDTVSVQYIAWLHSKFGVPREKLLLIPNGVNISFFSPSDKDVSRRSLGLAHYKTIIGYVGALRKLRNLEILIRSFKLIENNRNIGLVLVGDGEHRTTLEKLVEEEGLTSKVNFIGQVPYSAIPDYMRAFDIGVDLTLIPMEVEGKMLPASYSQKIPQYLACGIPVIAWDIIDNQFLKEEGIGESAPIGDSTKLAKSILRLLDIDEVTRAKIKRKARMYAEINFSISKLVARRLEVWHRLIESR